LMWAWYQVLAHGVGSKIHGLPVQGVAAMRQN
jgi:hypothetical protein